MNRDFVDDQDFFLIPEGLVSVKGAWLIVEQRFWPITKVDKEAIAFLLKPDSF